MSKWAVLRPTRNNGKLLYTQLNVARSVVYDYETDNITGVDEGALYVTNAHCYRHPRYGWAVSGDEISLLSSLERALIEASFEQGVIDTKPRSPSTRAERILLLRPHLAQFNKNLQPVREVASEDNLVPHMDTQPSLRTAPETSTSYINMLGRACCGYNHFNKSLIRLWPKVLKDDNSDGLWFTAYSETPQVRVPIVRVPFDSRQALQAYGVVHLPSTLVSAEETYTYWARQQVFSEKHALDTALCAAKGRTVRD